MMPRGDDRIVPSDACKDRGWCMADALGGNCAPVRRIRVSPRFNHPTRPRTTPLQARGGDGSPGPMDITARHHGATSRRDITERTRAMTGLPDYLIFFPGELFPF